jgi:hypothetical protein
MRSNIVRSVEMPEPRFSDWYRWSDRTKFPDKKYPGVYIISISPREDLAGSPPLFSDVCYIGMTAARGGLASRWRQFFHTVQGGRSQHSGAKTIFLEKGAYEQWREHLYVAAFAVPCEIVSPTADDYVKMGWVAFMEYEAFADTLPTLAGIRNTTERVVHEFGRYPMLSKAPNRFAGILFARALNPKVKTAAEGLRAF